MIQGVEKWTKDFALKGTNLLTAAVYFYICMITGIICSTPGSILEQLVIQVHKSFGVVSYIFTARAIGNILGGFFGGYLLDITARKHLSSNAIPLTSNTNTVVDINKNNNNNKIIEMIEKISVHQICCICIVGEIISMNLLQSAKSVLLLYFLFFVMSFCTAILASFCNLCLLALFGNTSDKNPAVAPYLQFLHFSFGVGAFIGPLLIQFSYGLISNYSITYYIVAILYIPAFILFLTLPTHPLNSKFLLLHYLLIGKNYYIY